MVYLALLTVVLNHFRNELTEIQTNQKSNTKLYYCNIKCVDVTFKIIILFFFLCKKDIW